MTLGLADVLLPELAQKGLTSLFRDIEMPLVPVLVAMEAAGIRLDADFLRQMSVDLTDRLHHLEREIYQVVGYAFNINSTQQLLRRALRQVGAARRGAEKDAGRHLLHGRRCAGRAARQA